MCARQAARSIKVSSSSRVAYRNLSEAALTKTDLSKGARKRITHMPLASSIKRAANANRTCLFIKLRVTERRAWHFGTTIPSHQTEAAAVLSTDSTDNGAPTVHKFFGNTVGQRLGFGSLARWCTAKCKLRVHTGVRNTRSKSTARTRRSIILRPPSHRPSLDSQALATLGATCIDHGTATAGLHAH